MAKMDFGPIADDYAFFMTHSTEAECGAVAYADELVEFRLRESIRMLDFGCGGGEFTERLLALLPWRPEKFALTLVEPVESHAEQAAERLGRFSQASITHQRGLPVGDGRYDLVLANHALYFVSAMEPTMARLFELLSPDGLMLLGIAGWDNALVQFWRRGFDELGQSVPYYVAEDVEAALTQLDARFTIRDVPYQIRFLNLRENRERIIRFLFGEYFDKLSPASIGGWFAPYVVGDHIHIETHCWHFAVGPSGEA